METAHVTINMDAKCAECGRGGAAASGICLGCTSKAIGHQPLRSGAAKAMRARFHKDVQGRRDAMATTGDNSDQMLKRFAERIAGLMDQIKDIKDEVKTELQGAKAAGLDVKALNKIVKELGMEADDQQKQLRFEWEVDAYRKVVGLPTEIAIEKQEAA